MTDTCPTSPALLAWIENDLPDEESQLLNTHVGDCEEFWERLALMNAVQDVALLPAQDVAVLPAGENDGVATSLHRR